ncbi:helix-turn-helix domain-containing protein [Chitinophaga solisilvae]|uniref:helix-turn-helix domain-containing protein n=1 Tax=Chitinophaga solisilvae TaxID=1233460 RepID=UPI00137064EE|nr:helix-turn-helix domain-containing protein [Chitinophaga solisilvae]
MARDNIILHQEELDGGVEILPMKIMTTIVQPPHRDDHFMFILQLKGVSVWELDFNKVTMNGAVICFIAPGQVHRYLHSKKTEGWLIFANPEFVSRSSREIFDTVLHSRQNITATEKDPVYDLLPLLEKLLYTRGMPLKKQVLHSMTDTITGMIAAKIIQGQHATHTFGSQKYTTATRFRQLVKEQYKESKQVKDYAALLNITPLYLNEVMKEITGLAASYWIQQEIMLEAKRLLYYTDLDIKEIAYQLGYEDHAYFSRFFRKHAGMTASSFRDREP